MMKTRGSAVREKERVPVSIPYLKVNGIRKIDKEERDKRLGLTEEKMNEMKKSNQAFFQMMFRQYG